MDETLSINIMYYAAGANMTFLTMMSIYFLRTAGKNKRLKVVTGYVLLLWAIQSYKDAFMLLGGYYECDYLRKLFIMFDTPSIATCAFILFELLKPKSLTWKTVVIHTAPFLLLATAYIFTKEERLYTISTWYSAVYGLCIMTYSLVCIPIYHKHMKETYSYSENIDLKWLYVIIFSFVLFLGLWSFSCYYLEAITDTLYYFLSCFIWLLICRFINRQENVEMEIMTSSPSDFDENNANTYETETQESKYAFAEQFNKTFEEKKLYLNPRLTIIDLAHEIGTNRTYISDYLNNELGITFFDYVNQRRLLYAEELLRTTDDSLDSISMESGFNSQSTFRRAFQKKYGCTPGVYRSKINNSNK